MPRQDRYDDTMMRDRDVRGGFFRSERDDRGGYGENRRPMGRGERNDWFSDDDRGRTMSRDRDDRERMDRDRQDRHYGSDDHNRGVPMDETEILIASNKVEGTPVYDRFGDKLGTIHNFMVHKTRGQVVYAVLKHSGGFLGLNERYYPLEWNQLTYDTRLGGYHTKLEEEDLKSFGSFDSEGRWHRRQTGRGGERSYRDHDDYGRGRTRQSW